MSTPPDTTTYMFVFRYPVDLPDRTPEQMQQSFQKWMTWIEQMKNAGHYIAGEPLEDMPGKVLRGPRGARATDGPFAEAKEVVAGYLLIRARDFEQAVELARGCPGFETANTSVEVRQIKPMAR